jgi:two-component sensor histidine kinase
MTTSLDPLPMPAPQQPMARLRLCWPKMARNGLKTLAFCLLISVGLWLSNAQRQLAIQVVYSISIGMTSWLFIDAGRFFVDTASPTGFPRGWRGGALIAVGVLVGFFFGTAVGDLYAGHSTLALLDQQPRAFWMLLLFTMVMGVGISTYFYATGRAAYLKTELEVSRRHAAEAQLKLLQTQMEPHMLFNTLANLRALMVLDPARATDMLDRLVAYLRATLQASRATAHPLHAEFDRLQDYLELMAVRMGPRLRFTLNLPAALADCAVPTLLLQPLVENSIKHGLEPKISGGTITVTACQRGEWLVLTVADSGVGMPADAPASAAGFGQAQVRERLATRYGANARFTVAAPPDGGTLTTLELPMPASSSSSSSSQTARP